MELAEIDDDIEAFLVESYENLDEIERDIINLEKAPPSEEVLVRIYRSLHTLKGNCGFLPFPKLESLAHAAESLLSRLRDRQLAVTPGIISTLLQVIDTIRQILAQIKATKQEGDRNYPELIQALTQLQETAPVVVPTVDQEGEDLSLTSPESYIRVNVTLLDRVMDLVGELVLTHNQAIAFSTKVQDSGFAATCQRLSQITADLQAGVMKTRLQPISSIWQKFPRVIRDLAIASGKQVQVEMLGVDTEIDKSIIEAIKDPLTHLVRNCIDHGIELPSERIAKGKSTQGRIFLKAFHESGKVNIEIGDDGRGINLQKLKQRAQQLGLISPTQAATLSDSQALDLIFLPGFSTTEQVTNLSGRGVGMDIVKRNIEKINGSLEIQTQPGQGTRFKIKMPLTLTIMPALLITTGGDRYAIPQTSLQELVRLDAQAISSIEMLYDVPVYRLRGEIIPLVYLNQALEIKEGRRQEAEETLNLVIIQVEKYRFGLVVDTIEDIQDIVVKPLGKQLKNLSVFAGATIIGDGTVALIIDVVGLAKQAGVSEKHKQIASLTIADIPEHQSDRQMILLFTGPENAPMGVPLTQAFRLEKIPTSAVEKVANQYVMQYKSQILPLIDLYSIFSDRRELNQLSETLEIAIVSPNSQLSVGLVVERIVDIVEAPLTTKGIPSRPGVLFCTAIQGQITEILDLEAIIQIANPYLLTLSKPKQII
jgi:two-component system, chemotaxis family, sensor kinase CheA